MSVLDTASTLKAIVAGAVELLGVGVQLEQVRRQVEAACERHGLDPLEALRQIEPGAQGSVDDAIDRAIASRGQ